MQQDNPYATPNAPVGDILDNESTGEIKILTPKGRMGRVRYFYYSMLVGIIGMIVVALAAMLMGVSPTIGGIVIAVAYIGMLVWSFFLVIQRCHDLNKSGWWSLLLFVPFAFLYFYFAPGTPGANHYGLKPPENSKGVIAGAIILPILMFVGMGVITTIAVPAFSEYEDSLKTAIESSEAVQ